jgi:hypothetical protein
MLKPLPITTYTFRKIIEEGLLYVDKTQYLYELIQYPSAAYFLSRPRRFGKSLLISTLDEIFRGNKELFQGLWIYQSAYQWEVRPVIRIDFSRHTVSDAKTLVQIIDYYLEEIAQDYGLVLKGFSYQSRFQNLIRQLAQTSRVVILIDEYDKPIIDNLENVEEAKRIRDTLKAFYGSIKAMDQHLHMAFITGISKFSQVGVFSTLNNLVDLTMNTRFASMLGLTEAEIRLNFADYVTAFATERNQSTEELLAQLRTWYDGFCFAPNAENVYNPYSVVHLFYQRSFTNHWFETGTPTFLIKLIRERNYDLDHFDNLVVNEIDFKTYELESLEIVPLLFQTGYLTIKSHHQEPMREIVYTLGYPNYEVENSFFAHLLNAFSYTERTLSRSYLTKLIDALKAKALDQVFEVVTVFFANVPYNLHLKYEQYYQSIFYTLFTMIGMEITAEVETNDGRIDAVVELTDHIFLFEFKIDKSAKDALQQIKDNHYYHKYRLHNKPMTLVGANFNSKTRTVDDWTSELDKKA